MAARQTRRSAQVEEPDVKDQTRDEAEEAAAEVAEYELSQDVVPDQDAGSAQLANVIAEESTFHDAQAANVSEEVAGGGRDIRIVAAGFSVGGRFTSIGDIVSVPDEIYEQDATTQIDEYGKVFFEAVS